MQCAVAVATCDRQKKSLIATIARLLLDARVDIIKVMPSLGHRHMTTTQVPRTMWRSDEVRQSMNSQFPNLTISNEQGRSLVLDYLSSNEVGQKNDLHRTFANLAVERSIHDAPKADSIGRRHGGQPR